MLSEYNFDFGHQRGWECPRCGKILAPWMPCCDCKDHKTITVTWDKTGTPFSPDKPTTTPVPSDGEWWKQYITCTQADSASAIGHNVTTWCGGSDYWNEDTKEWENIPKSTSNSTTSKDNPWHKYYTYTSDTINVCTN